LKVHTDHYFVGTAVGLFGTTKSLQPKTNAFAVGSRLDTLKNQDAGLILIHVANEKNLVIGFVHLSPVAVSV
jgi:hypothetical protein